MNADEKERIAELRKGGIGYKIIAQILNMNCNTVTGIYGNRAFQNSG